MSQSGRHAVVIGSGIGGLIAARVLTDHFDRVSVLDRDAFPVTPDHRPGAPQSRHVHGLQRAGADTLYDLFPGLHAELLADGAQPIYDVERVKIVTPEGLLPLVGTGEEPALFFSRFHLEWRLRERVKADRRVGLHPGVTVVGLVAGRPGTADRDVRGVRVQYREWADTPAIGRTDEDGAAVIDADLVVDTSGRSSNVTDWLDELGYGAAVEETLSSELSYASRFYARPDGVPPEFSLVIVNTRPPEVRKAGLIQDIENGQWHVTLGGVGGETPPTDEEGFLRWASELADPSVYEAIRVARPLTPIRGWRTPTSRWRHFERMADWPSGLIALGDAVCALNPIYGQGMTVAAKEGLVLRDCLREDPGASPHRFERGFQRRLARTVAGPWLVASTEDLRLPTVRMSGARPPRWLGLMRSYLDRVLRTAVHDHVVAERYFDLIGMTRSPAVLFSPSVLARVARHAVSRAVTPGSAVREPGRFALSPEALAAVRALPSADADPGADAGVVPAEPTIPRSTTRSTLASAATE